MKKIFNLKSDKKDPARVLEATKNELRKYLKRERTKTLPEEATFWEFDCAFGTDSSSADPLKTSELTLALDKASQEQWERCYVEIIARPSFKERKKELEATETIEETDIETLDI